MITFVPLSEPVEPLTPAQSSSSWRVGYTVPATQRTVSGSSAALWHEMQALPGFICLPVLQPSSLKVVHGSSQWTPLVQVTGAPQPVPWTAPPSTQAFIWASSSAPTGELGAGGMILPVPPMRARDS